MSISNKKWPGNLLAIHLITVLVCAIHAQDTSKFTLPAVEDPVLIGVGYSSDGRGRIRAAEKSGMVHQYFEVWPGGGDKPSVVTYFLIGNKGELYTATWGMGKINSDAFDCKAESIPQFGDKIFWVATTSDGKLTFQEIASNEIKGLFRNLTQAHRDWAHEVNSSFQRSAANSTEQNILILMSKKNREKWAEAGWLRPASGCVLRF